MNEFEAVLRLAKMGDKEAMEEIYQMSRSSIPSAFRICICRSGFWSLEDTLA